MTIKNQSTSLYYEDFEIGDNFETVGRTIDQADINLFAGLSGDNHYLHTNEDLAAKSIFGKRVAHGVLTTAITTGLIHRLGIFTDTGLSNLGSTERYTAPVFAGDTLYAIVEVIAKKPMGKQRGMVTFRIDTANQNKKIVVTQEMNVMVRCREECSRS